MVKTKTSPKMMRFNEALCQAMRVSKSDLNRILEEDAASRADKPKRGPKPKSSSASGHASNRAD